MDISEYVDFTLIKPTATERDIINLCDEAKKHRYYAICVNSCYVALAKQILKNSSIKICTVVGYPLGAASTEAKVYEAKKAIEDGSDEIDMVINLGYLKSRNYVSVLKDISDVKFAIGKTRLKVVIEISKLNKNEIIKACEICLDAKADFIKTSSGFSKSGATLTAVKIIKKTVKDSLKIQAFDGIDDYETAVKYLEAGADRIGTSSNIESTTEAQLIRNTKIFNKYLESLSKRDTIVINADKENIDTN